MLMHVIVLGTGFGNGDPKEHAWKPFAYLLLPTKLSNSIAIIAIHS